jgi:hypothetical protein
MGIGKMLELADTGRDALKDILPTEPIGVAALDNVPSLESAAPSKKVFAGIRCASDASLARSEGNSVPSVDGLRIAVFKERKSRSRES